MIVLEGEARTLGGLAERAAEKYPNRTAFQVFRDGGVYDALSYGAFGRQVRRFAARLVAAGVRPGDRVMILAENRPAWPVAYFGAALAGAVVVPVLVDFAEDQVRSIALHSGAAVICCTARTAAKAAHAARGGKSRAEDRNIIEENSPGGGPGQDRETPIVRLDDPGFLAGDGEDGEGGEEKPLPPVAPGDPAVIIYTSGTTGASKGVVLSHENLLFTAQASRSLMRVYPRDRLLSVIPLAHTYECVLGLLTPVMSGASITYLDRPPSPAVLLPAMQALRPTAIVAVPLLIEKICRARIFPALAKLEKKHGKIPLMHTLAVKAAGARLMSALGSSLRFFGIGGAPLAGDVEEFLRAAGFPYAPGYGLTETSPLVAGTAPYRFPAGSAGAVVPGVEVRISPEGEIQVRGPNVMLGYYRDEAATRAAFTADGWLKTGDLGALEEGRGGARNLFIKGRLKALILGPSGENIYPEEIESLLASSVLVEDALVVPGDRGELVALVVLSPEALGALASQAREKAQTALAALGDGVDTVLEDLKASVNRRLAAFSRLARIEVLETPFEKTPTQKIKRFLYASPPVARSGGSPP